MEKKQNILPLRRVNLPRFRSLKKYLKIIDNNLVYSNNGPLVKSLQRALSQKFNVNYKKIVITSSGTMSLQVILTNAYLNKKIIEKENYFCIVPSYTFVASVLAIIGSGLKPIFLDIDFQTGQLTPGIVEEFLALEKVKKEKILAVMPVSTFGAKINKIKWDNFAKKNKIDIVYDEAWCFDSFSKSLHGNSAISLHATKSFGCGEGGLIIANTIAEGEKFRSMINFGLNSNRLSNYIGTNGKMSEYHAAVALASLDKWQKNKEICITKQTYYLAKINKFKNIEILKGFDDSWVWGALPIIIKNIPNISPVIELAKKNNIEMRDWWGSGTHKFPWAKKYLHYNLISTKKLVTKLINIPFYSDITFDEIDKVCRVLEKFDY